MNNDAVLSECLGERLLSFMVVFLWLWLVWWSFAFIQQRTNTGRKRESIGNAPQLENRRMIFADNQSTGSISHVQLNSMTARENQSRHRIAKLIRRTGCEWVSPEVREDPSTRRIAIAIPRSGGSDEVSRDCKLQFKIFIFQFSIAHGVARANRLILWLPHCRGRRQESTREYSTDCQWTRSSWTAPAERSGDGALEDVADSKAVSTLRSATAVHEDSGFERSLASCRKSIR